MNSLLDIVGSFIIGGLLMLILFQVNASMQNSTYGKEFDIQNQTRIIGDNEVIAQDFYRIGYRVYSNKILSADSTSIKFRTDYNNYGTTDTIFYYLGRKSELAGTENPNDMPLYRVFDKQSPVIEAEVTDFKLTYLDSTGSTMNYSSLVSQNKREKIRSIKITIERQSPEPVNNKYQSISWQQVVRPKNLM